MQTPRLILIAVTVALVNAKDQSKGIENDHVQCKKMMADCRLFAELQKRQLTKPSNVAQWKQMCKNVSSAVNMCEKSADEHGVQIDVCIQQAGGPQERLAQLCMRDFSEKLLKAVDREACLQKAVQCAEKGACVIDCPVKKQKRQQPSPPTETVKPIEPIDVGSQPKPEPSPAAPQGSPTPAAPVAPPKTTGAPTSCPVSVKMVVSSVAASLIVFKMFK